MPNSDLVSIKLGTCVSWAHKTCSTSPLFIEVPVPSQESEHSCTFFVYAC